jgi:S1-C subfamily serine protease
MLFGSGVVVHEDGYALVCGHVFLTAASGIPSVLLQDGRELPCRPLAFMPEADVSLVKIASDSPLKPAALARCGTVQPGEEILIMGHPDVKLGQYAWGTVGRLNIDIEQRFEIVGDQLGPGYSGGPIFNRRGEVIGLLNTVELAKKGVAYGVPIDCVRREFAEICIRTRRGVLTDVDAPESLHAVEVGIQVSGDLSPTVIGVWGPAKAAGVQAGDVLSRIGDMEVRDGMHAIMAQMALNTAEPVDVHLVRGGEPMHIELTPNLPALHRATGPLVPGIRRRILDAPYGQVLNFEQCSATETKITPVIDLAGIAPDEPDMSVRYDGYVRVPTDGEYRFDIRTGHGGAIYVAGRQVAFRDQVSGPEAKTTPILLQAGLHPIRVDCHWIAEVMPSEPSLQVFYEGPDLTRQPIPAEALSTPKVQ